MHAVCPRSLPTFSLDATSYMRTKPLTVPATKVDADGVIRKAYTDSATRNITSSWTNTQPTTIIYNEKSSRTFQQSKLDVSAFQ